MNMKGTYMNGNGAKMTARHERKKSYAKEKISAERLRFSGKKCWGGGAIMPPPVKLGLKANKLKVVNDGVWPNTH